jgi:hypothetical protein
MRTSRIRELSDMKTLDLLGFIVSCGFLVVLVGVQIVSMYRGYDTSYPLFKGDRVHHSLLGDVGRTDLFQPLRFSSI